MDASDPLRAAFDDDPYPQYARLRASSAVPWSDAAQAFVLTRYEDVSQLLRDPLLSAARSTELLRGGPSGPLTRMLAREILLVRDPPEHTRLRALVNQAFSKSRAERLRERVARTAQRLLAALPTQEDFDFLPSFAVPLPLAIIAELLGVPEEGMPNFRRWATDLAALMDPVRLTGVGARDAAETALADARRYFEELFVERRRRPGDDLVSTLVSASCESDRLSRDELFTMCVLILIAGHETTANLLGTVGFFLFSRPELLAALRNDPSLVPAAVEELLRYETIAKFTGRVATEELRLGGCTIPRGATVIGMIAAANRDPAVFEDADRLDLSRTPNPHLAFGIGRHFCLGASLARMEAVEAVRAIASWERRLRVVRPSPCWKSSTLRGLAELRVA